MKSPILPGVIAFALLVCVVEVYGSPWKTYRLAGTLHRLPVRGELRLEQKTQNWDVEFWFDDSVSTQVKMLLEVHGDYIRRANGDLECQAAYTDARIVLRPTKHGYRVVESNVDMILKDILPQ